jgi:hypothetical protein
MFGQTVHQQTQLGNSVDSERTVSQPFSSFQISTRNHLFPTLLTKPNTLAITFLSKSPRSESCLGVGEFSKTGSISGFVLKRKLIP